MFGSRGDISRKQILGTFNETCASNLLCVQNYNTGGKMRISKSTVAYKRDTNLRDILYPSTL